MNAGPIQTLGYLNPPWTPNYGYAQVEQIDNRLRIVGLMSLDTAGNLVGPASYVRERIAAFREAGVTNLQITPAGGDPVATVAQIKEWVG